MREKRREAERARGKARATRGERMGREGKQHRDREGTGRKQRQRRGEHSPTEGSGQKQREAKDTRVNQRGAEGSRSKDRNGHQWEPEETRGNQRDRREPEWEAEGAAGGLTSPEESRGNRGEQREPECASPRRSARSPQSFTPLGSTDPGVHWNPKVARNRAKQCMLLPPEICN